MAIHLSARLVWHDRGWDGHICNNPGKNSFCEGHIVVREHKDTKLEDKNSKKSLAELDHSSKPACESSLQAFCQRNNAIVHFPPSFMNRAHPEILELSEYSILNWTFEEMWTESGEYRSQKERFETANKFYTELKRNIGKSLVFFYVDERNPVGKETANRVGQRILVGVSKLIKVGDVPIGEWTEKIPNSDENYKMWAVEVKHGFPQEGVRIPYQEYLSRQIPIEHIAIPLVGDLRERFKYVGKHIDDDTATILIEKIIESIKKVSKDGLVEGSWSNKINWLNRVLKDVWTERGPYPGVKGILNYLAKAEEGASFQKEIVNVGTIGKEEFITILKKWLDGEEEFKDDRFKEYIKNAKGEWEELSNEEKDLLLKFGRFELSEKHIKIILNDDKRREHGILSSLFKIAVE